MTCFVPFVIPAEAGIHCQLVEAQFDSDLRENAQRETLALPPTSHGGIS